MRRPFWAFTVFLILLFSGCANNKGENLVFFYDKEFDQIAEFTPRLFLGEDKPFFKELSQVCLESGYALNPVSVDVQAENFIGLIQKKLPKNKKQLIITSFLYSNSEIQELIAGYQVAVVGAALDIPLDKLRIIGNGFRLIEDEGRLLASAGKEIRFVALKSGFQQLITDSFKEGAGNSAQVFEAELNAKSLILPMADSIIVASYGPSFKSFSSPSIRNNTIRVINYPGSPEYVDPNMKKKVESFICYDFGTSFKSAILELASGRGEKKSFYSFDLVRR